MKEFHVRIKPNEFAEWNERMIIRYDPDAFHHHPNPFVRFIERERVKSITKLIEDNVDESIIEVGCGAGNILEKIRNGKIFGVDISSFILIKARQKLKERVHIVQADAQNLPYRDKVFGQIICSEVLEHVLDPSAVMDEMKRILKINGVAIISVPNESLINWIKRILSNMRIFTILFNRGKEYSEMPERMDDEWHLHAFPLKEWLNLFRKLFRVTHVKKIPFPWIPLRYVVRLEKKG